MTDEQITVSHWWGRRSGWVSHCSQNGWREATWVRDKKGWHEINATLRPVVGMTLYGEPILGEPRPKEEI